MITVKYDDTKVTDDEVVTLSHALKEIVAEATKIPEVFVYADSPKIKINVASLEVFIEMSANKVEDKESLFKDIIDRFARWKADSGFIHPATITLIPVDWKFEVGL